MGLWDFVKSAGKSLGIGSAEAAEPPAPGGAEAGGLGSRAEA